jgi:hypothetical protein
MYERQFVYRNQFPTKIEGRKLFIINTRYFSIQPAFRYLKHKNPAWSCWGVRQNSSAKPSAPGNRCERHEH